MLKDNVTVLAESTPSVVDNVVVRKPRPKRYKTARQLGILPEERAGLIAFLNAPFKGRVLTLPDGSRHLYDQTDWEGSYTARLSPTAYICATAGCFASVVLNYNQSKGILRLRGQSRPASYGREAMWQSISLAMLYGYNRPASIATGRRVVRNFLRTGKVRWR